MTRLLAVVALSVVLGLSASTTRLRIVVTNEQGKPVRDASVIVRFLQGRSIKKLGKNTKMEWELKTNQEGSISIPPIPQGTIQVQIIAKGYQTFGDNFDVDEEEKTLDIKLRPPQKQYTAH